MADLKNTAEPHVSAMGAELRKHAWNSAPSVCSRPRSERSRSWVRWDTVCHPARGEVARVAAARRAVRTLPHRAPARSGWDGRAFEAEIWRVDGASRSGFEPRWIRRRAATLPRRPAGRLDQSSEQRHAGTEKSATPVIAMGWCRGDAAGRVAAQGPLPVGEAVDCVLQIIAGLELTTHGILHRDIKPRIVSRRGRRVKVGDFGLRFPPPCRLRSRRQVRFSARRPSVRRSNCAATNSTRGRYVFRGDVLSAYRTDAV